MLTQRQHNLLMFVHGRLKATGVAPSFTEMRDALDLNSKSGIHRLLGKLEERGFVRRMRNRARSIEVLKLPGDARVHTDDHSVVALRPTIVDDEPTSIDAEDWGRLYAIAERRDVNPTGRSFPIPRGLLPNSGSFFALDLMLGGVNELGVLPGDRGIFVRSAQALTGDLVLLLTSRDEVLFGRYRRSPSGLSAALEFNSTIASKLLGPGHTIVGRMVTLLRRFKEGGEE